METRVVRTIGYPDERYAEDPVQTLRALNFSLASDNREAIVRKAPIITSAAPPRVREEIMTLFRSGVSAPVLHDEFGTGLSSHLFPGIAGGNRIWLLLKEMDKRPPPRGCLLKSPLSWRFSGYLLCFLGSLSREWKGKNTKSSPNSSENPSIH